MSRHWPELSATLKIRRYFPGARSHLEMVQRTTESVSSAAIFDDPKKEANVQILTPSSSSIDSATPEREILRGSARLMSHTNASSDEKHNALHKFFRLRVAFLIISGKASCLYL